MTFETKPHRKYKNIIAGKIKVLITVMQTQQKATAL